MTGDVATGNVRYAGAGRDTGQAHPATDTLRLRYEGYVLRQGRDLLALLPRSGVRELLRAYRRQPRAGVGGEGPTIDELAVFASTLLPLPPFGVWAQDFSAHRGAYLAQTEPPLADGPTAPDGEPVTVNVRTFSADGHDWVGELLVRPVPEGWRGSIHFHRPGAERAGCTGEVFREGDLTTLRDRFSACDSATLQAFLRSALP